MDEKCPRGFWGCLGRSEARGRGTGRTGYPRRTPGRGCRTPAYGSDLWNYRGFVNNRARTFRIFRNSGRARRPSAGRRAARFALGRAGHSGSREGGRMSVTVPGGAEPGRRRRTPRARSLRAVSLAVAVSLTVSWAVIGGVAPAVAAGEPERERRPGVVLPPASDTARPSGAVPDAAVDTPGAPDGAVGATRNGAGSGTGSGTGGPVSEPSVPDLAWSSALPDPQDRSAMPPSVPPVDPVSPVGPAGQRAKEAEGAGQPEPDEEQSDEGLLDGAEAEGPRSPVDRRRAATTVTRGEGFVAVDFDLGDTALPGRGGFRAPVRGQLVLPASGRATKLVLLSHLRSGNCSTGDIADGGTFAYPCPAGSTEVRYDRGWRYLAESLARKGYTALIPDLGPVWVGHEVKGAYDQVEAVLKIFGRQRDALAGAVERGERSFGTDLRGRVDLRTAAFVTHSRSGYAAEPIARRWASGPTRIHSQYLLAPALEDSAEDPYGPMSAPPADIPWLTVIGSDDEDTGPAGSVYLSDHLGQRRAAPAGAVTVRGFGHNYFNRVLSAARADDRMGCGNGCPGAREHERLLTRTLGAWLDHTGGPRRSTGIAALDDVRAAVPRTFGGVPARWLIAGTPSARRESVLALPQAGTAPGRARKTWTASGDATARACRHYHPQDPTRRPGSCDETTMGLVRSTTNLLQVRWRKNGAVSVPMRLRHVPEGLALHLMPFGATGEDSPGTPVRLTLRDTAGRTASVDLPASDPALANVARGERPAGFQISTVRVPLKRFRGVDPAKLDRLTVGGTGRAGGIMLRQAEFTGGGTGTRAVGSGDTGRDEGRGGTGRSDRSGTDRGGASADRAAPGGGEADHMLSATGGHTLSAALLSLALIAIGLTFVRHSGARRRP
ncbi:Secreted protein [Streptomyces clavuligerus]|uniref:Secreted protein n=1 Tax=Streptomyces clavuligerus TaxID=1901 RepID=E2PUL6_STRCL|nr:Secreted protein [Streptomyces clavuligerus]